MSGLIKVVRKAKPFFSRVDEAAKELPRTKGTGKEFMAELKKQPGVKKAELDDRKLSELESAPKMTKEEFIQKLEQKPAPKIEESIKAHPTDADLDEMAMKLIDDKADELTERKLGKRDRFNRYDWDDYKEGAIQYLKDYDYDKYLREAKRNIEENVGADFPKYEDYKLPGGENYREILLKLPSNRPSLKNMSRAEYNAAIDAADKAGIQNYQSQHWDEPNVLAHIRVQDRVGPNGEKILHVEEIQSDWHQEGRKRGYGADWKVSKNEDGKFYVLRNGLRVGSGGFDNESMAQRALDAGRLNDNVVPDAPFKKNWHELATKRIMDYAIQNGYDKVAITPGAEQASRYDLSKQIDQIKHAKNYDGTYDIAIRPKGEQRDMVTMGNKNLTGLKESELEELVGKEVAQKIVNGEGPKGGDNFHTLAGLDLNVGGEGMKGFYDQILPAYINKEYGKYGASIGKLPVETGKEMSRGLTGTDMIPSYTPTYTDLHSIDITPEMRETIQSKGQPLYQATGIGLTGAAAAPSEEKVKISDNPDTMMLELQDQGFAGGGLLKKAAKAIKGTQEVLPAAEREANLAKMLEDSAIKDRVYHSTNADIRKFSDTKLGKNTDRNASSESYAQTARVGHWFSTNPLGDSPEISKAGYTVDMPVYLSIKNPKREQSLDWLAQGLESKKGRAYRRELERQGYDGIVLPDEEFGGESWVAFRPEQIKSATGNRGTYDVTDPDITKSGGGLMKRVVKGAQAVLPTAEREANLQRMLAESKAPMRLYHGTTATEGGKGQEAIRRIKPSKEGSLGSGVYLTPKTEFANEYAHPYIPGSSNLDSGNVLPVYAQIKNPLIIEGKGDPMIEALIKLGMDEDKAARMVERAYENRGYIGKEVETRARAAGYDGLMQYRDGDLSEVVSYNPNAVKSAIGNQGTYDITDPDLNKAVGGLARAKRK